MARKFEDDRAVLGTALLMSAMEDYFLIGSRGRPVTARKLGDVDAARLQKMWSGLEKHPNAALAVYGRLGGVVHAVMIGRLEDSSAKALVRDFRLAVQAELEKGETVSPALRYNLYFAATNGLNDHGRFKLPGCHEELKELCDFMLRRQEVFPPLVEAIADQATRAAGEEAKKRYAYDVLLQAQQLLEDDETRFLCMEDKAAAVQTARTQFSNSARQSQAKIHQLAPAVGAAPTTPWEKATTLLDVAANTSGIQWLQRPLVHDGSVYVAAVRVDGAPAKFAVQLLGLTPGKDDRFEGKPTPVELRRSNGETPAVGPRRFGHLEFGTAACIHEDRYYLGTKRNGIFILPFNDAKPERITTAEGLPSDVVQSMTSYGDRLYAVLGVRGRESYVVAWDLKEKKCEILASSHRKGKRCAFDDNVPIFSHLMLPDPERKRVLFLSFTAIGNSKLNGLWSLDPKGGDFKQLVWLQQAEQLLCGPGSYIDGNRLMFVGCVGKIAFNIADPHPIMSFDRKVDLATDAAKCMFLQLEESPKYRITMEQFNQLQAPHLVTDGWVWGSQPFSRRRPTDGKVEYLASPRPGQSAFTPSECMQFFRDREVLIADTFGIWLVTLPKK